MGSMPNLPPEKSDMGKKLKGPIPLQDTRGLRARIQVGEARNYSGSKIFKTGRGRPENKRPKRPRKKPKKPFGNARRNQKGGKLPRALVENCKELEEKKGLKSLKLLS